MGRQRPSGPYPLFMLGLCVYVLAALAARTLFDLSAATDKILDRADTAIGLFFFADFLRCLAEAVNRRRYLLTWGWLDLLSSIPTIDLFRWGRMARVVRILRVLRGLKATRVLSTAILARRAESALWSALLLAILVIVFGSIAILNLEVVPGSNIRNADDAMWWAFVTITTVGYGDTYPVTPAGRVLAGLLMITGIGLFGTFTAYVASVFMAPAEAEQDQELAALRADVRALRETLERDPGGD